jgi:hypothetical protein
MQARDRDGVSPVEGAIGAETPAPTAHYISMATRLPHHQRFFRAGSVVTILALLLVFILLVPTSSRDAFLHVLIPPTPAPTAVPQPGDNAFLWEHSVPWGQLLIDGKPGPNVSGSAGAQEGQRFPEDVTFHLGRGRHTLEYHADEFPTLRCTVSVPYSRDDTCPLDRGPDMSFGGSTEPLLRILDLRATIDRLSPTETKALIQATREQLATVAGALPPGTLRVGDHYTDAQGQERQVTAADAPVTITPQFHLATRITSNDGSTCVTLCTGTAFGYPYTAKGWSLLASVELSWRYARVDGRVVLDEAPSAVLPAGSSVPVYVLASSPVAGRWQIDIPPSAGRLDGGQADPVLCLTADDYRRFVEVTSDQGAIGDGQVQWPYEASTAELGCLLAGGETDLNTGKPSGSMALLLYRAGVLLAVNDQARKWYPTLPQASAHERALAQAVAPTSLA